MSACDVSCCHRPATVLVTFTTGGSYEYCDVHAFGDEWSEAEETPTVWHAWQVETIARL